MGFEPSYLTGTTYDSSKSYTKPVVESHPYIQRMRDLRMRDIEHTCGILMSTTTKTIVVIPSCGLVTGSRSFDNNKGFEIEYVDKEIGRR